jgi:hypothetical protein
MAIDEGIQAKLHEAASYLSQMRDRQDRAFGDSRPKFDEYLAAFVQAGRSVVLQLERNYDTTYPSWRKAWNSQHQDEDRILKAMHDRRDANVHQGAALGHSNIPEPIKVGSGSFYSDKSGRLENFSCPGPLLEADLSVTIHKPRYFFGQYPVMEKCAEYLTVLEKVVADFERHLKSPATGATPTSPVSNMISITTYKEYKRSIVDRDFQDFMKSKGDLRKAWHCAISLFHLHDWVYVARQSSIKSSYKFQDHNGIIRPVSSAREFANSLAQKYPEFQLIRGIANAAKHLELNDGPPGPTMPRHAASTSVAGRVFDPNVFDPNIFQTGEVMLKGLPDRKFAELAQSVLNMWNELFSLEGW